MKKAAFVLALLLGYASPTCAQLIQWETREGELEPAPEVIESEEGPLFFAEDDLEPLFEADLDGYPDQYEGPAEPIDIPLDASAHLEELADAGQEAAQGDECIPIIYACCGHFVGGIELLSTRPCLCDLDYAIQDSRPLRPDDAGTLPSGDQKTVLPDRDTGIRFFVTYIFEKGCLEATAQFTASHGKDSDVSQLIDGDGALWPTDGSPAIFNIALVDGSIGTQLVPALAEGVANNSYEGVDLFLARRWMASPCVWGKFSGGLHYAHLWSDFLNHYQGAVAFEDPLEPVILASSEVSKCRSIFLLGPRVGCEAFAQLGCGFGLTGRFVGAMLIGQTRGELTEKAEFLFPTIPSGESVEVRIRQSARTLIAPYTDLRLGVYWSLCCPRLFKATIEFGYEVWTYVNVFNRRTLNHTKSTNSTSSQNMEFDAFYLRLQLELYR